MWAEIDGSFPLKTSGGDGSSAKITVEPQLGTTTHQREPSLVALPSHNISPNRRERADWEHADEEERGTFGLRLQPSAPILTETLMATMSWDRGGDYIWRSIV